MSDQTAAPAAFLGVEQSLSGKFWRAREADARMGLALAQRLKLPELIGRLLAARGVDLDAAPAYLNPTLKDHLPDPSSFRDMDVAAERLAAAVRDGEAVAIFGDYDVDGATSSALLHRFLSALGQPPRIYIPDREREGYGPNIPALRRLYDEGAKLVITVDCGATAHDPLAAAASWGLEVVVCDHHVGEPARPPALALVNPNRFDETTPHRQLAAVGVAFLLAVATNRALRRLGWFAASGRAEPNLMALLDLVALGTVADVAPLTGINRALVAQGLKVLQGRANVGIAALADRAKMKERADAYHLGFVLGPRVNAGGRVGRSDLGARLLSTEDPAEARQIAEALEQLNDERREIEAATLEQAVARAEALPPAPVVCVAQEGWRAGVVGIVAARLKERYDRPAVVGSIEKGVIKASARSVPGAHIGDAVIAARQAGLATHGGGHAMAAGFSCAEDCWEALCAFLAERLGDAVAARPTVPSLSLDGGLDCAAATAEFAAAVARLGPFGQAAPEPRFVVTRARVVRADIVGQNHVRAILTGAGGGRLKAIAFRSLDTDLGAALLNRSGGLLHVAGKLRLDDWSGGEEAQLLIDDAAWVGA